MQAIVELAYPLTQVVLGCAKYVIVIYRKTKIVCTRLPEYRINSCVNFLQPGADGQTLSAPVALCQDFVTNSGQLSHSDTRISPVGWGILFALWNIFSNFPLVFVFLYSQPRLQRDILEAPSPCWWIKNLQYSVAFQRAVGVTLLPRLIVQRNFCVIFIGGNKCFRFWPIQNSWANGVWGRVPSPWNWRIFSRLDHFCTVFTASVPDWESESCISECRISYKKMRHFLVYTLANFAGQ